MQEKVSRDGISTKDTRFREFRRERGDSVLGYYAEPMERRLFNRKIEQAYLYPSGVGLTTAITCVWCEVIVSIRNGVLSSSWNTIFTISLPR